MISTDTISDNLRRYSFYFLGTIELKKGLSVFVNMVDAAGSTK